MIVRYITIVAASILLALALLLAVAWAWWQWLLHLATLL